MAVQSSTASPVQRSTINVQRPRVSTLKLERETLNRAEGAILTLEPVRPLTAPPRRRKESAVSFRLITAMRAGKSARFG
jgi:hypothetical protein